MDDLDEIIAAAPENHLEYGMNIFTLPIDLKDAFDESDYKDYKFFYSHLVPHDEIYLSDQNFLSN